jgi:formylglycine-generating enzyme
MRKLFFLFSTIVLLITSSCTKKAKVIDKFIFVEGGDFVNTKSKYYGKAVKMPDFYIGKYEITQKEWTAIMGNNPSKIKGDNLPVESVNWYDCVEYCNKRSVKEGLKPYYIINKKLKDVNNDNELDLLKWTVTINSGANGFRLPIDSEWEYAAGGGQLSKNYTYSGSNNLDKVGWYWENSGDIKLGGTWMWGNIQRNHCSIKPVGTKAPNELGLYDMSGNVREWCWEWKSKDVEVKGRAWKGGASFGTNYVCEPSYLSFYTADVKSLDLGFRLCRGE